MGVLWIIAYLALTVSGLIFIKLGADSVHIGLVKQSLSFSMGWRSLVGYCCYLGSFIIYTFKILKDFDLGYITPLCMGIAQILILVAAHFVFKEQISTPMVIGIALILAGVVLLNVKL